MGFYVPDTLSDSFVTSKRTQEGNYAYEEQKNKVGVMEQRALQDLGESYSETINNAYSSYLASQRAILGSSMGEGFKQEYLQRQQENLMEDIANSNLSLAKARSEIQSEADTVRSQIDAQRTTEVEYLDRAINSMQTYMDYLNSYENENEKTYLEDATGLYRNEYDKFTVDEFYDYLINAQPTDYKIGEERALPYYEWMRTQMKDTQADREFEKWFYGGGGYEELKEALPTVRRTDNKLNSIEAYKESKQDYTSKFEEINKLIDEYSKTYEGKGTGKPGAESAKEYVKQLYDTRQFEKMIEYGEQIQKGIEAQGGKIEEGTWVKEDGTYKGIGGAAGYLVTHDSGWKKIDKALSLNEKLDNGELKENDLIKYDGQLYIIGPYRSLIKVRKV